MEEAERTKSQLQEDMTNFADPNDRASQEEEFSLELRNRDRERKLLKKLSKRYIKFKKMITVFVKPVVLRSASNA